MAKHIQKRKDKSASPEYREGYDNIQWDQIDPYCDTCKFQGGEPCKHCRQKSRYIYKGEL